MSLTTIEKRALRLPRAKRVALAEKLLGSVDDFASRELQELWELELGRRVMEIKNGKDAGIPAKIALSTARKKLSEARRLPKARRTRTR